MPPRTDPEATPRLPHRRLPPTHTHSPNVHTFDVSCRRRARFLDNVQVFDDSVRRLQTTDRRLPDNSEHGTNRHKQTDKHTNQETHSFTQENTHTQASLSQTQPQSTNLSTQTPSPKHHQRNRPTHTPEPTPTHCTHTGAASCPITCAWCA